MLWRSVGCFALFALLGCTGAVEQPDADGIGGAGVAGHAGSAGSGGATTAGGGSAGKSTTEPPTLSGCSVFPPGNAWNLDVSELPLHPSSDRFVDSVGRDGHVHPDFGSVYGIPYTVVPGTQPRVPINFMAYGDESDPGPYPVPADAPVEGGADSDGDRHVLVIDGSACVLYELYRSFPQAGGGWNADSGAVWDLEVDDTRPVGWTSADAAGLPVFAGLVRYDETVVTGEIRHALRFTVSRSQAAYVAPATHYASSSTDADLPPMGLRFRMKAGYDCSEYSREAQVVCAALKKYGMIVADNGSNWYISGAPDPRWDDDALNDLKLIPGDAFEVVDTGPIETY